LRDGAVEFARHPKLGRSVRPQNPAQRVGNCVEEFAEQPARRAAGIVPCTSKQASANQRRQFLATLAARLVPVVMIASPMVDY
jgi:hypothetical protein